MKYTIKLTNGTILLFITHYAYTQLTDETVKFMKETAKSAHLRFKPELLSVHLKGWNLQYDPKTMSILSINIKNHPKGTAIPYTLQDGRIRFGNLILLIDDKKNEELPKLIGKLTSLSLALHMNDLPQETPDLTEAIMESFHADGVWDMQALNHLCETMQLTCEALGMKITEEVTE